LLSRQFCAGLSIDLLLAAVLIEQGLVTQRSRSWLTWLIGGTRLAAPVLLRPLYHRLSIADEPCRQQPVDTSVDGEQAMQRTRLRRDNHLVPWLGCRLEAWGRASLMARVVIPTAMRLGYAECAGLQLQGNVP
jgi:hypothetical protein